VSPAALKEHAGSDHAMKWLAGHEDGTGPYKLVTYSPGNEYVLQRFGSYWGPQPYFKTVTIHVIPDVATAELELRSGSLDMLPRGVPFSELPGLTSAGLKVNKFAAAIRQVVLLNPSKAPFNNQTVRQTALAALQSTDATAVSAVFGPYSEPARSEYPQAMSAGGPELAPVPTYPTRKLAHPIPITFTYTTDEPALLQLAQYFQQALDKVGFQVTLRGDTVSQEFGYITNPKAGPNATLSTYNPDASYPDTWARPVWHTGGGLNLFDWTDPKTDQVIDAASTAPTAAKALQLYGQAGERAAQDAFVFPVDDTDDVTVSSSSLTGFSHVPAYIWMVDFADLKRG
jgi:peptide/nickel transport system substrate-binding protein